MTNQSTYVSTFTPRRVALCLALGLLAHPALAALLLLPLVHAPQALADKASDVVTPGVTIHKRTGERSSNRCTLGFIMKSSQGFPVALTAGHCSHDLAEHNPVGVSDPASGSDVPLGQYRESFFYPPGSTDTPDIALLGVDNPQLRYEAKIAKTYHVAAIADPSVLAEASPKICYFSAMRGERCGPLDHVDQGANKLWFQVPAIEGESGSPVFSFLANGDAVAVGIRDSAPKSASDLTVAEMVAPWASKWGLTLY